MSSPLYLYNTLHKRKEEFIPLDPPNVGFYSCGPTVYHYAHIGNLRTMIMSDILKRVLMYDGYHVTHIMNITDVGHLVSDGDEGEDKMEKGAAREGKSVWDVAKFYTDAFLQDIQAINLLPPTRFTKATEHIEEQIELIKTLEEKGFTYVIDDGVYFDTSKFPSYGQLTNLQLDQQNEGARVAVNDQKRNSSDFALWKFSPKDEQRQMEWPSPWGKGFPGWHIECSAMAMAYLGHTLDIHTGGEDLAPVHHTNEIAQSEAATGKPFSRFWLHGAFVVLPGGDKMSKSGDNFSTLSKVLEKGYDGLDYRFLTLNTNYRSPLTFTETALDAAKYGRERLNQFVRRIYELREADITTTNLTYLSGLTERFEGAINDDLNMPEALSVVFELVKDANTQIDQQALTVSPKDIWQWLMNIDQVLGLKLEQVPTATAEIPEFVQTLLTKRQLAREQKDWAESDRLRDEIVSHGYLLEDTSEGQKIRKA